MEPTQLQLVLNVVTITAVTSLAGYCYLLKKENRRLALERKAQCTESVQAPASAIPAGVEQDIRTFASTRRTRWVKGASSISR